jgi:hypothetical protein
MTTERTMRRRLDLGVTVAVGLFAAANSYNHVYSVARNAGQDKLSSALLWFTVDGLILVGVRNMKRHPLGHVALWAGVAATMAAQVLCGLNHGAGGIIVSVWPAGAFLLCAEIATRGSARETAPEPVLASASPDAPRVQQVRRSPATRSTASRKAVTPAHAERRYADQLARGKLPSMRSIQRDLKVGQRKAQKFRAHLAALAA